MKLKQIKSSTLQSAVYDELFQAIISGRIAPGEKITLEQIASHLNVSVMPVRGAIARLETRKIVTILNNRKIIVNELSPDKFVEIYEVRILTECYAAKKAAQLRSEASLATLEELIEQMNNAADSGAYLDLNRDFHHLIYSESYLAPLLEVIMLMWERVSPYFYILMDWGKDSDRSLFFENHHGMLDALERKDSKDIQKWVERDLTESKKIVLTRMMKRNGGAQSTG